MRSKTLTLLGLFTLAQGLPSGDARKGIDKRQSFGIGGGNSEICTDSTCLGKGTGDIILPPGFEIPPEFRADQPVKRHPQRGGGDDRRGGGRGDGGRGGGRGGWDDDDDDDEWRSERGRGNGGGKGNGKGNGKDNGKDNGKGKGKGGGSGGGPPPHVPDEPKYPEPHYPDDDPYIPPPTKDDIIEKQLEYQIVKDLLRGGSIKDPSQRRALESRLRQLEAFLKKYVGIVDIDAPPGTGTIFVPGRVKRSDDVFELLKAYTRLTVDIARASPTAKRPSLPVYMLACQIADILIANGINIDTSILDSWTEFGISNKAKRQDGIFKLPGTCTAEDIISLQTTLSTIQILYGRNPPFQIANLMNAVAAALQFCKVATPGVGKIIPDPTVPGSPLVPEKPVDGAPLVPERPVGGGAVVPERPVGGGAVVPERPVGGGAVVPEQPVGGGAIVPEKPVDSEFRPGRL